MSTHALPFFLLLVFLSAVNGGNKIAYLGAKGASRPPPTYRCVSILGVCGKTITPKRCLQMCYANYDNLRPYPHCDAYPGSEDAFCLCEHDCMPKETPKPLSLTKKQLKGRNSSCQSSVPSPPGPPAA